MPRLRPQPPPWLTFAEFWSLPSWRCDACSHHYPQRVRPTRVVVVPTRDARDRALLCPLCLPVATMYRIGLSRDRLDALAARLVEPPASRRARR